VKSRPISTTCAVAGCSTLNSSWVTSRRYRYVLPERSMSLKSSPSGVTGDSAPSPLSFGCVDFVIDLQKLVRGIQQLGAWCF